LILLAANSLLVQAPAEWRFTLARSGEYDHIVGLLSVGDLDGDSIPDLIVGARGLNSSDGLPSEMFAGLGRIFAISGASAKTLWNVDGPTNQERPNRCGEVLANLGDINGDAIDDIAVGIHYIPQGPTETDSWYPSTVRILSGKNGSLLREHSGSKERVDGFGVSITSIGDIDGDGHADYAIGASNAGLWVSPRTHENYVALYSGHTGEALGAIEAAQIAPGVAFGTQLAALGDLDRDGVPDLAIRVGATAHFGGTWCVLSVKERRALFTIDAQLGIWSDELLALDDRTGDGVADLALLGADRKPASGRMFVALISGADGALVRSAALDGAMESTPSYTVENARTDRRLTLVHSESDSAARLAVFSAWPLAQVRIDADWKSASLPAAWHEQAPALQRFSILRPVEASNTLYYTSREPIGDKYIGAGRTSVRRLQY
jgi:hypothetical protein